MTEEDTGNLQQPRQENLKKKKKKPKRSLLREMMSFDSEGSSYDTRSPESNPNTFPVSRVGDWEAP